MRDSWDSFVDAWAVPAWELSQRLVAGAVFRGARLSAAAGARLPLPTRLGGLVRSALAEVRDDLASIPDAALALRLAPMLSTWRRAARGEEEALRALARFSEAARAKLAYGVVPVLDSNAADAGSTPRKVVHADGKLRLFRYRPARGRKRRGAPLLIVPSIINRSWVLDLVPGFSFVEHLLAEGLDVFIVEWGDAERGDRRTLDDLIDPGLARCVEAIRDLTGAPRVSVLGQCIGGVLASAYAALHPHRVERLLTLTTPFAAAREGGIVALWTDRRLFPVDAIVKTFDLMPGKLIRWSFLSFKPYYEWLRWKTFFESLGNDAAVKLLAAANRWLNENPDLPAEVFRKFAHEVYLHDRFRRGETMIRGRKVDLSRVVCPVLNVTARKDWVVPAPTGELGTALFGGKEKRTLEVEGHHVSLFFDPRLRDTWKTLTEFLTGPERIRRKIARKTAGRACPAGRTARRKR